MKKEDAESEEIELTAIDKFIYTPSTGGCNMIGFLALIIISGSIAILNLNEPILKHSTDLTIHIQTE